MTCNNSDVQKILLFYENYSVRIKNGRELSISTFVFQKKRRHFETNIHRCCQTFRVVCICMGTNPVKGSHWHHRNSTNDQSHYRSISNQSVTCRTHQPPASIIHNGSATGGFATCTQSHGAFAPLTGDYSYSETMDKCTQTEGVWEDRTLPLCSSTSQANKTMWRDATRTLLYIIPGALCVALLTDCSPGTVRLVFTLVHSLHSLFKYC